MIGVDEADLHVVASPFRVRAEERRERLGVDGVDGVDGVVQRWERRGVPVGVLRDGGDDSRRRIVARRRPVAADRNPPVGRVGVVAGGAGGCPRGRSSRRRRGAGVVGEGLHSVEQGVERGGRTLGHVRRPRLADCGVERLAVHGGKQDDRQVGDGSRYAGNEGVGGGPDRVADEAVDVAGRQELHAGARIGRRQPVALVVGGPVARQVEHGRVAVHVENGTLGRHARNVGAE